MTKFLTKNRILLFLVILTVVGVVAAQYTKAQTQPSTVNFLSFYVPPVDLTAAASTTYDVDFCVVQSESTIGGSVPMANGQIILFRYGVGAGVVNSVSNLRVQPWALATSTGNDLTASDLTLGSPNAAGRFLITNTSGSSRNITHGMTICATANVTSAASAVNTIIDNANNVNAGSISFPRELLYTVR